MSPTRREMLRLIAGGAIAAIAPVSQAADAGEVMSAGAKPSFRVNSLKSVVIENASYEGNAQGEELRVERRYGFHRDVDQNWILTVINDDEGPPRFWTEIRINDPEVIHFLDEFARMLIDPPGGQRAYPAGTSVPEPYASWREDGA